MRTVRAGAVRAATAAILLWLPAASPGSAQPGETPGLPAGARIAIDRDFIVGRWADHEDCSDAVDFAADGTFVTHQGAEGLWILEGDRMTLAGGETSTTLRIIPIDRDTIDVVNPDGSIGHSIRCEGESSPDAIAGFIS